MTLKKNLAVLLCILLLACYKEDDIKMNDPFMNDLPGSMENPNESDYSFKGSFTSVMHPTTGTVVIDKNTNMLSLINFKTDNGPALEVYLATDVSPDNFISLGPLKGTNGNYNYVLSETIDFKTYNHVIIWCVDFSVNFGYAVLLEP